MSEGPEVRTICVTVALPQTLARPEWRVEDFELHKELYRGKTSLLYMATDKRSGMQVALKLYRKRKLSTLNRYQVEREIRLHINLNHENIIRLFAAFEDEKHVYMVQEFAVCGDLFEDLKKGGGQLKEKYAVRDVIVPFLSALNYLHAQGIIHRDIKPENILLGAGKVVKVADFGLSINIHHERPVTRAGTLDYMAPEVLVCPDKRRPEENKDKALLAYTAQVDSWAVGILAYELLVGYPPFEQESRAATYEHIMYKDPKFPAWMSDEAKRFITTALCKNATQRPTVFDLYKHSWLQPYMHPQKNPNITVQPSRLRNSHSLAIADDPHASSPPAAPARGPAAAASTTSPKVALPAAVPTSPLQEYHHISSSSSLQQPCQVPNEPITGAHGSAASRAYGDQASISEPAMRAVGPAESALTHDAASPEHASHQHQHQQAQHHQLHHHHHATSTGSGVSSAAATPRPAAPVLAAAAASAGSFSGRVSPAPGRQVPPPLAVEPAAYGSIIMVDDSAAGSGQMSPTGSGSSRLAQSSNVGGASTSSRSLNVSTAAAAAAPRTRMGPGAPSAGNSGGGAPQSTSPGGRSTLQPPVSPKPASGHDPAAYHRPASGVLSDDSFVPIARTASSSAMGTVLSPLQASVMQSRPSFSRLNSPSQSRRNSGAGAPCAATGPSQSTPLAAGQSGTEYDQSDYDSDAPGGLGRSSATSGAKYSKLFSKMWGARDPGAASPSQGGDWASEATGGAYSGGGGSPMIPGSSAGSFSGGARVGRSSSRLMTPPGGSDLRPLMRESSMSSTPKTSSGLRDDLAQGSMTVYMRPGKAPGLGRAALAARQQQHEEDAHAGGMPGKAKSLVHRALGGEMGEMVGRTGSDLGLVSRGNGHGAMGSGMTSSGGGGQVSVAGQRSFTSANTPFAKKLANGVIVTKVSEYVATKQGKQQPEDPRS